MGTWGYYSYPSEPPSPPDWEIFEYIADEESKEAFIEQEMSYADAMATAEEIATDEGGWGCRDSEWGWL